MTNSSTYNKYTTENGPRSFSGVVQPIEENITIFEQWNHEQFNTNVPVGIDMKLIRAMEGFLDVASTHVNAKRIK